MYQSVFSVWSIIMVSIWILNTYNLSMAGLYPLTEAGTYFPAMQKKKDLRSNIYDVQN